MADAKVTALSEVSVPALEDLTYWVDDPSGTPTSAKASMTRVMGLLNHINQFRLTLTSGTPVTSSDVTGATSIYMTPYNGNKIAVYDGTRWKLYASAELTFALGTLTSARPYDLFVYDNAGTLTLEATAWTNDTTRATALTTQDGVYVKTGATTRRYLGTFYTTSTTTTEDSAANRYLWNVDNRVARSLVKKYGTAGAGWTYNTSTWRPINNDTTTPGRVNTVCGIAGCDSILLTASGFCSITIGSSTSIFAMQGIGIDSTSVNSSQAHGRYGYQGSSPTFLQVPVGGTLSEPARLGAHYYQHLECSEVNGGGSGSITYYNEDTTANRYNCGLVGVTSC